MIDETEARAYAKYLLKKEMQKAVISTEKLAVKLNMDNQALFNKISRASFTAGFFLHVLNLLECKNLDLSDFEFFTNKFRKAKQDEESK